MTINSILKHWVVHFLILISIVFLIFLCQENDDISTIIFGTTIYAPYFIGLTVVNIVLIVMALDYLQSGLLKWALAFFVPVLLVIWYLTSSGQIHYWKMVWWEFALLDTSLLLLNLATVQRWMEKIYRRNTAEDKRNV